MQAIVHIDQNESLLNNKLIPTDELICLVCIHQKLGTAKLMAEEDSRETYSLSKLTAEQIQKAAQRLYDQDNWSGLKPYAKKIFTSLKDEYKKLTGAVVNLEYTCPS